MLARFPDVPRDRGHYESFYVRAAHPDRPLGAWLRHTIHKAPGGAPTGALWVTLFDGEAGGPPRTFKAVVPAPRAGAGGEGVVMGESRFALNGLQAATPGGEASWDLRFTGGEPRLAHLPRPWMYRAPLPRTKSGSPHPHARLSGTVVLHGRTLELDGWPGMAGHNWGSEHAERWIWLHGTSFEGAPGAWVDLVCGRIRVGGRLLPWVANGALQLDGRRLRLGGIGRARATRVEETPTGARLILPGEGGLRVRATVSEPPGQGVAWRYADPSGGEHHAAHCSIARLELELPGGRRIATPHGAAYELGMRETDHGVPIAPFADP